MMKTSKTQLWVRVYYTDSEREDIDYSLKVYALLHSDRESSIPTSMWMQLTTVRLRIQNLFTQKFATFSTITSPISM